MVNKLDTALSQSEPEVSQPVAEGYMVNDNGNGKHLFVNWFAKPVEGFLYSSPPDYEALRQRVAELESENYRLSIANNIMESHCDRLQSELTQEIEDSKAIQKVRDTYSAECVRLQSECDSLSKLLTGHAIKPYAQEALEVAEHDRLLAENKALRKLLGDEAIKSMREQAK